MFKKRILDKDRWKLLFAILALGSIWGLAECVLGSLRFEGMLRLFPMGALLGGLVGLGLMVYARKTFGNP